MIFGATVDLEDQDDGKRISYQIVGEDEADIKTGRISITSPIARAIVGKSVGDVVDVVAPGRQAQLRSDGSPLRLVSGADKTRGWAMKRFAVLVVAMAALGAAPQCSAQDWIPLQDGKSLAGWKAAERPESWVVEDGAFVTRGERCASVLCGQGRQARFQNFEFSAEVMTSPGRQQRHLRAYEMAGPEGWPEAGYELQVINSNPPAEKMNGYIEHKMTGSIYAVRNTWVAPAKDNEWFNYRIRVVGKTIQTFINDKLICEYAEPENAFRPHDKKGRLLGSGTFALQAHDPGSVVKYRNMKVKILPDDATPPAGLVPLADRGARSARHAGIERQHSADRSRAVGARRMMPRDFWSDARRYGMTPGSAFRVRGSCRSCRPPSL